MLIGVFNLWVWWLNELSRLRARVECDAVINENFRESRREIENRVERSRRTWFNAMRLVAVHQDYSAVPSVLWDDGIFLL